MSNICKVLIFFIPYSNINNKTVATAEENLVVAITIITEKYILQFLARFRL